MNAESEARMHFEAGMGSFKASAYEAALAAFEKAIALAPNWEQAYVKRGSALMRVQRMKEAIGDFNKAIALGGGDERTFNLRGLAHANLGDHESAYHDFTRSLAINPDFCAARMNQANALAEINRRFAANRQLSANPVQAGSQTGPDAEAESFWDQEMMEEGLCRIPYPSPFAKL